MKSAATEAQPLGHARAVAPRVATAVSTPSTAIHTRMKFAAPSGRVWGGLMFYEQIRERPPLHLRLLLPLPIGTEGPKSKVGDEVRCFYEGGHLLKRITRIDPERHYGFEIVEQNLALAGGLTLSGGCYTLRELSGGGTEVAVTTRYVSSRRPDWLWKPIEAAICHGFHRFLLAAMRRRIESL